MANRIFSTGQLFVTVPSSAAIVAAAVVSNAAAAGATTTSNFTDPDLAADPQQYDGLTPATGPATLVIWDLGASYTLSGVTAWYSGTGYQFDCSEDGATWGSELAVSSTFSPSGTEQALTPTGRYVRFRGTDLTETAVYVNGASVGGTPQPIELVTLQNITFGAQASVKELRGPVQVSAYAIARVYYNMQLTLKATYAAFSAAGLKALLGAINTTGTGPLAGNTITTIDQAISLPSLSASFQSIDINGVSIRLAAGNVSAPNVSLPYKIDDYLLPSFDAVCYPDPTSHIVAVVTIGS